MADDDQAKLLQQFREVSGVDDERAKFYMEAANWELQAAMGAFFEGEEGGSAPVRVPAGGGTDLPAAVTPNIAPQNFTTVPPRARPAAPRGGLMTMDALLHAETDSSDEDEDDKPQAFYAGGSLSSGQQVLGPPKSRDEMIADMFKKAREMGAQEVPPQMFKKKSNDSFGGAGYKLGEGGSSSTGATTSSSSEVSSPPEVHDVILHLWSNGFTVDDGPLRSYQDPANLAFLDSVKRGEVPAELRQKLTGQDCTLSIMDKRGQDYEKGATNAKAFTGKGQTLGSPVPTMVTDAPPPSENERKVNEQAARSGVTLAPGAATTSIQFRLTDGSRLAAQFNHTHTVQDLYTFINTARPEYSSTTYILTLFPNVTLTEKGATLKDANILNSSLIQKIQPQN